MTDLREEIAQKVVQPCYAELPSVKNMPGVDRETATLLAMAADMDDVEKIIDTGHCLVADLSATDRQSAYVRIKAQCIDMVQRRQ